MNRNLYKTFSTLLHQTQLPPESSYKLLRSFRGQYSSIQSVAVTSMTLQGSGMKQYKRVSSDGQTNNEATCALGCSNASGSNNCEVLCNGSRQTVSGGKETYFLGWDSTSYGNPASKTIYMYFDPDSTSTNTSNCYAIGSNGNYNLYSMTFYGCLIDGSGNYWEQKVIKLMSWYWGFNYQSGLSVACYNIPSGTYNSIKGPTIQNAFITVNSGSNSDGSGCYKTPSVNRVCKNVDFSFPGMSVDSNNDLTGSPTPSTSPNYGCLNCCYGSLIKGKCPSTSSSANCQCFGYSVYYMWQGSQFAEPTSCWYQRYYRIVLSNMVSGYGSSGGADKTIKKWIFWYNGLNANELNIDNFTLNSAGPGYGTKIADYYLSGFGINNIKKSSNGYYETPSYFSIGAPSDAISGNYTSPLYNNCYVCPVINGNCTGG